MDDSEQETELSQIYVSPFAHKLKTTCALIYRVQVLLTHEGFRYWPTGCLLPLAWQCATESDEDQGRKGYGEGREGKFKVLPK